MQTKLCKRCNEEKPITVFSRNRAKPDGLHYNCKPCDTAKARAWYEKNAEKAIKANKQRRQQNLEEARAKDRALYSQHKDEIKKQRRAYYEANKKHIVQRVSVWAQKNKEKVREYGKSNYRNNKPKYMARSAVRRASKIAATPSWLSAIELAQIQEMYDVAEALTMQTGMKHHVDHIHPLKGHGFNGLHVPWNLQVIPAFDNLSKGNRLPAADTHMSWEA